MASLLLVSLWAGTSLWEWLGLIPNPGLIPDPRGLWLPPGGMAENIGMVKVTKFVAEENPVWK